MAGRDHVQQATQQRIEQRARHPTRPRPRGASHDPGEALGRVRRDFRTAHLIKEGIAKSGYLVALDVGTSSVRAILYDLRARLVQGAEVQIHYKLRTRPDGMSETDPDKLAGLVGNCLAQLARLAGPRRVKKIVGVGTSTFWHGLVATDDSASALTPLYLWSDSRSWRVISRMRDRLDPEEVRLRTGCPIHPSYWPAKLAWLREERPDLWRRPVRWLSFGDLLYWRLFGKLGTSLSMASGTGLLRLADGGWDEELLSDLGVRPESLPPIAVVEQGLTAHYRRLWPTWAVAALRLPSAR
jgi:gluconokinase